MQRKKNYSFVPFSQIFSLNAEKQQLQAELLTFKHMTEEELHQQIINVDEQCKAEAQASKVKQDLLQEEVEERKNQYRTLMAEHHESEFAMRKVSTTHSLIDVLTHSLTFVFSVKHH